MLEKDLVKKIKTRLERDYPAAFFWKVHGGPYQQAGIPDLCGVIGGRAVYIEVKVPGRMRTLTPLQMATIEKLRKAGAIAFATDDVEEASRIVGECLM